MAEEFTNRRILAMPKWFSKIVLYNGEEFIDAFLRLHGMLGVKALKWLAPMTNPHALLASDFCNLAVAFDCPYKLVWNGLTTSESYEEEEYGNESEPSSQAIENAVRSGKMSSFTGHYYSRGGRNAGDVECTIVEERLNEGYRKVNYALGFGYTAETFIFQNFSVYNDKINTQETQTDEDGNEVTKDVTLQMLPQWAREESSELENNVDTNGKEVVTTGSSTWRTNKDLSAISLGTILVRNSATVTRYIYGDDGLTREADLDSRYLGYRLIRLDNGDLEVRNSQDGLVAKFPAKAPSAESSLYIDCNCTIETDADPKVISLHGFDVGAKLQIKVRLTADSTARGNGDWFTLSPPYALNFFRMEVYWSVFTGEWTNRWPKTRCISSYENMVDELISPRFLGSAEMELLLDITVPKSRLILLGVRLASRSANLDPVSLIAEGGTITEERGESSLYKGSFIRKFCERELTYETSLSATIDLQNITRIA